MPEELENKSTDPADSEQPKLERIMDITMLCRTEIPPHPVTVYRTTSNLTCPHCNATMVADMVKMSVDHPKHEIRQIVEKGLVAAQ